MILELDSGNSLIKWRVLHNAGIVASGAVHQSEQLFAALNTLPNLALRAARMVCVRTDEECRELVNQIAARYRISIQCARAEAFCGNVRNGYADSQRLGVDRWVAVLGAYQQAQGACLVLDLGTALTADFVAANGEHLGGFIGPGLPLMRNQLRSHTRRIRYEDSATLGVLEDLSPGHSTVEAVERGLVLMLQGFAKTQLELAQRYWGDDFQIFLTGGDASLLASVLPQAQLRPDLMFIGLAIACPLP